MGMGMEMGMGMLVVVSESQGKHHFESQLNASSPQSAYFWQYPNPAFNLIAIKLAIPICVQFRPFLQRSTKG